MVYDDLDDLTLQETYVRTIRTVAVRIYMFGPQPFPNSFSKELEEFADVERAYTHRGYRPIQDLRIFQPRGSPVTTLDDELGNTLDEGEEPILIAPEIIQLYSGYL